MEDMGTRLKRLRRENNLTQEFVGNCIGVKKAAINKYENGNVENIKRSSILKLSKLYGVNPSYLLCFDDYNYNLEDCSIMTNLYIQLDVEDRAEIKGEMKQMLKAEKYTKVVAPEKKVSLADMGNLVAEGGDKELHRPKKKKPHTTL